MGLAKYIKDDKDRISRVEYPSGIEVEDCVRSRGP